MTNLAPGGNAPVATGQLRVEINYSPIPDADIDVSAFALGGDGKARGDTDMCFYGQTTALGGAVQLSKSSTGRAVFTLDLSQLEAVVEKVALTATIYENSASFDRVSHLALTITGDIEAQITTAGMKETALILGEFYRRQGEWKFRCVAQGFAGGLSPLAKHFGLQVAEPVSAIRTPVAASTPTVNLSKITLDKTRPSISLEKTSEGFGEIKVNLNWTKRQSGGGFFSRNTSIDLDVGCLYQLLDGSKGVVQALGNCFGELHYAPYIQLKGDDRTGAVSDGEWLHINGKHWADIRRILVFAFIYDGAPNWRATDGVVTIHIPKQPSIEVRLNEEGGRLGMCAIAVLENVGGSVKVSRRVDFHTGHSAMDKAYDWGMRWSAGSK